MNTVNPFNKDELGIMKSRQRVDSDVSAALSDLVNKTQAEGIVCWSCAAQRGHMPARNPDPPASRGVGEGDYGVE